MNYAIEHNEVDDSEIKYFQCGCVFDGFERTLCEAHQDVLNRL